MESRKILAYLSLKHRGDWDKIFEEISLKKKVNEKCVERALMNIHSQYVTIVDEDYPESLRTITKPPFVLFYHGDISLIKNKGKCLSVVGARECTEYGAEVTKLFVKDLCKHLVIVSGMALGIDGISHRTALENNQKTVAVLGCGVNVCYPPDNLDIYDQIRKKGLLISEYPNLTQPAPYKFPIRNRIVAGLSSCLLVTQAELNSGTSITATLTLEQGGNVCCVPTRIGENSLCNHLISYGAFVAESSEDVLDVMKITVPSRIF